MKHLQSFGMMISALALVCANVSNAQSYSTEPSLDSQVDEIIKSDSQGWAIYSYDSGSAHNSYISQRFGDGGFGIHTDYSYGGGTRDSVDIYIRNNVITCIRYSGESCRNVYTSPSHTGAIVTVAVIAALVAAAASGSGRGSGSSSSSSSSSSNDPYYPRQNSNNGTSSDPPAEQPRTHGLYGDCPQSGAGYGC